MSTTDDESIPSYELIDEEIAPLEHRSEEDFEQWLLTGLEGYLFEEKGAWAFPEVAGTIASEEYLVDGLRNAYSSLSAQARQRFRRAVAKVLASLEPTQRNVLLFELLLALASRLPAPEVLRVLPSRVGNGFFGLNSPDRGDDLFGATLLTVATLAAPREEARECLNVLISSSNNFDTAYSGIALVALCQVDDRALAEHMATLRQPLSSMFHEFDVEAEAKQELARSLVDAVGLRKLVHALPLLRYFDSREGTPSDVWLIDSLLSVEARILRCIEDEQGIYFYRPEKPDIKEMLQTEDGEGIRDLVHLLRERGYISLDEVELKLPHFDRPRRHITSRLAKLFNFRPIFTKSKLGRAA